MKINLKLKANSVDAYRITIAFELVHKVCFKAYMS